MDKYESLVANNYQTVDLKEVNGHFDCEGGSQVESGMASVPGTTHLQPCRGSTEVTFQR